MAFETISIIGGGWSAGRVDLSKVPGHIVAVNNAAVYAPRVDSVISMDRKWANHHWGWLEQGGESGKFDVWLRKAAAQNHPGEWPWLHRFANDHTMAVFSEDPSILNGTNSGGCALAWAYAHRPKTVYLFGYDLRSGPNGEGHWYGKNEPRGIAEVGSAPIHEPRYAGWAREYDAGPVRQFKAAAIEVINVSDISLIRGFRRLSPAQFNAGAR